TRTTTLKPRSEPSGLVALLVFLGLTLFLFAGEYDWMAYPLAAAAIGLTAAVRPPILRRETRWLDLALIVYLLFMGVQRVPVPPGVRLGVSPALRGVDLQLRVDAPVVAAADTPHPLSVNPHGTTLSILVALSV